MSLPFAPEPLEQLQARYPTALAMLYDQLAVKEGRQSVPSSKPEHVFDSEDGIRVVVSRERLPSGLIVVHFSASLALSRVSKEIETFVWAENRAAFVSFAEARWRAIARSPSAPIFLGVSDGMIPHWFVRES